MRRWRWREGGGRAVCSILELWMALWEEKVDVGKGLEVRKMERACVNDDRRLERVSELQRPAYSTRVQLSYSPSFSPCFSSLYPVEVNALLPSPTDLE